MEFDALAQQVQELKVHYNHVLQLVGTGDQTNTPDLLF